MWDGRVNVGATSVEAIDPDTSMATTTVEARTATGVARAGRAKAARRLAKASSRAPAVRCRRQPGRLGATASSRARLVKRTA